MDGLEVVLCIGVPLMVVVGAFITVAGGVQSGLPDVMRRPLQGRNRVFITMLLIHVIAIIVLSIVAYSAGWTERDQPALEQMTEEAVEVTPQE
jgi:hypothetical protein